jgi:glycosyltransferase involved in cell wall biosynthesis
MACGVPVVASNAGGLPEVIEHGVTGFLHPVGDVEGMAASASMLLDDRQLHQRVGDAAADVVRRLFCVDRIVPMYEEVYRRVRG